MLDPRLAHQARSRALTGAEQTLAAALEAIFATGTHDFDAVAAALQTKGVARPSGSAEAWTGTGLEQELAAVNAALDAHYARHGIGV
jgi:hypothetical protein